MISEGHSRGNWSHFLMKEAHIAVNSNISTCNDYLKLCYNNSQIAVIFGTVLVQFFCWTQTADVLCLKIFWITSIRYKSVSENCKCSGPIRGSSDRARNYPAIAVNTTLCFSGLVQVTKTIF